MGDSRMKGYISDIQYPMSMKKIVRLFIPACIGCELNVKCVEPNKNNFEKLVLSLVVAQRMFSLA